MYNVQRKLLSQNFLHNCKLVTKLVDNSSITQKDLVLEIGAGKGIITKQLIEQAGSVIAIELDTHWFKHLQKKFISIKNITLYNQDILKFKLPTTPYKVFANLPFSIEAKIVRKLLKAGNPPEDCYIVVMKEFAERFTNRDRENVLSLQYQPWFEFSIVHTFNKYDFQPVPNVTSVLLRIKKRNTPVISTREKEKYKLFISLAFGQGQPIKNNLRKKYSVSTIANALQKLGINKKTKPSHLKFDKWVKLYQLLCLE